MFVMVCRDCNDRVDAGKMYWHGQKCEARAANKAKWSQQKKK
jgi:hypothetical protein